MKRFLEQLNTIPELLELLRYVEEGGCPAAVTGLQPVQRACVGAALAQSSKRPAVFLCGDEREARQLAADLETLLDAPPVLLLSREWQLQPGAVSSRDWERGRLAALYAMARTKPQAVVATADALMARTMPPALLASLAVTLKIGAKVDLGTLADQLLSSGYVRCQQVEGVGQFAIRGGILDVFSPLMDQPLRCELFDDEIDSMGMFDPGTQRRTANTDAALLLPAAEVLPRQAEGGLAGLGKKILTLAAKAEKKGLPAAQRLREDGERLQSGSTIPEGLDRYLAAVYPETSAGVHYLPADALVFLCESGRVDERVKGTLLQNRQDLEALMEAGVLAGDYAKLLLSAEEFYAALADFPVIMADSLPTSRRPLHPRRLLSINARQLSSYGGSLDTAVTDLAQYRANGSAVLLLCGGEARAHNLHRMLEEREIPAALDLKGAAMPAPGEIRISLGALSAGCEWPALRLAVLTEGQLSSPSTRKRPRPKKESNRQKIQSYTDLKPGDLVVHNHHGVGRFAGIQRMPVDGVEKDYIKIDYAGGDCLYVPATALDLVSKYIGGGEDGEPRQKLNKLGGTEWAKQKIKAKKAAKDLAKGLTKLYAERQRRPGFAFSPDSPWQREFEEAFPYAETDDQLRAVAEIKKDMEKPRPMDRLLCGDVGYGKTEVALRAVMKCVLDGKQAAILVPTTVLAQQHYATALGRFRDFPVKIEALSRFTPPKEAKRILEAAKDGRVDLLIGTHKLLQKNMEFKDLGLLIIDEEQRFGVSHKERLKEMSRQVDVLTLSATPIPRTLNMALSGIRDMSTIEEPPSDRYPVQTFVTEYNTAIIDDAIRREVERGGQVYYLHNRTETIDQCAGALRRRIPGLSVAVAHGQMSEDALGDVMQSMADGEIQVLVCTTIIETGLDIPNANTLIIENADRFGLSQLHQLRGRVGRSARHAYAYFTYRPDKSLTEIAEKRLSAIRDFAEFGSGFKIAMRDLEIRGAGNLLGSEQSGHMMSVGYDMYLKLLDEAVLEERGEAPKAPDCTADLNVTANVDKDYVSRGEERMDLYRRMAAIRTQEDADDLLDEIVDRYGEPPKGVLNLIDIALLRAKARKVGIKDIRQKGGDVLFVLTNLNFEAVGALCADPDYKTRVVFLANAKEPTLRFKLSSGVDSLKQSKVFIEHYSAFCP